MNARQRKMVIDLINRYDNGALEPIIKHDRDKFEKALLRLKEEHPRQHLVLSTYSSDDNIRGTKTWVANVLMMSNARATQILKKAAFSMYRYGIGMMPSSETNFIVRDPNQLYVVRGDLATIYFTRSQYRGINDFVNKFMSNPDAVMAAFYEWIDCDYADEIWIPYNEVARMRSKAQNIGIKIEEINRKCVKHGARNSYDIDPRDLYLNEIRKLKKEIMMARDERMIFEELNRNIVVSRFDSERGFVHRAQYSYLAHLAKMLAN